jgi:hypothetical protein
MSKRRPKELTGLLMGYASVVVVLVFGSGLAANAATLLSFDFIFGSMAIAVGAIMVSLVIVLMFRRLSRSKLLAASISSIASLVAIGIVVLPWVINYRDYIGHKPYLDVAHSACTGLGVDWLATYTDDRRTHPVVIAGRNIFGYRRWPRYNDGLPAHWRPESASDIQLVVCIDRSDYDIVLPYSICVIRENHDAVKQA